MIERKLGKDLDETPPGSDIENNPGDFLKSMSPNKQGIFDFKRQLPQIPQLNRDLQIKDFSKLSNEELQYMLSLMNEQYIAGIDLPEQARAKKKKPKKPDSALRKVYGNIDPFLYQKDGPDLAAQLHFKKIESNILNDSTLQSLPENTKTTRHSQIDKKIGSANLARDIYSAQS